MSIRYVKRIQMAFDFTQTRLDDAKLPPGFRFVPWEPALLKVHADVKHRSFRNDFDGEIFPTFQSYERCELLMHSISDSPNFLPAATLLIAYDGTATTEARNGEGDLFEYAANIQGMRHSTDVGAIQNVAVLPDYRSRGLGRALVLGSLFGFRSAGIKRVTLEVTADNDHAVRLYRHIGFQPYKVYLREILRL